MPELNRAIQREYQNVPLPKVCQKLNEFFVEVRKIIEQHSDEELFKKKRYKWTGSTSLGAYLISPTSSHYDWAYKLIEKCKK